MKTKFILFVFYFITIQLFSQNNAVLEFDSTTFDFGQIKEEDGSVVHTFFFSNAGTDTLLLSSVKPGCGCTTADWSKGPVLPGQKGFIKAEYNPTNRPGAFNKAITVTSNAVDPVKVLIIKGEVIPRTRDYKDTFTVVSGNLRLTSNHIAFLEIKSNQIKSDTLEILNDGVKPMTLQVITPLSFANSNVLPEVIGPKERGFIILTYDASRKKDWGLVYDYITFLTNDSLEPKKTITLSANIVEDFTTLTEIQKKKSPKILFSSEAFDFGNIYAGDTVMYSFEFSNTGKSDLAIRKVKVSCGCTVTHIVDDNRKKNKTKDPSYTTTHFYKKGSKGKINIVFNSTGRKGSQKTTITVITNDPDKPVTVLSVTGKVIEK